MASIPSKLKEFSLVSEFKLGYRNKEDITNLPPGVLIVGSQNVLTNDADRIQVRQGYAVDGSESEVIAPILASFDWLTRNNGEKHLRAGFLTSAANDGKLQYRYVDSDGEVTWRDLLTSLTSVSYNFAVWWNTTESLREVLFVNGATQIQRWNGATTTLASATVNTITKSGTDSWADAGFYTTGDKNIVINGTTYAYTGGETTTTLTGVTGDPSGEAVGSVIHQAVVTTAMGSITGPPSTFRPGLIATLNNQVYIASLTQSVVWLSEVNSYTDYSSSSPRQPGEGGTNILDANIVGFAIQGSGEGANIVVSAGKDLWYKAVFTDFVSVAGDSGQTFSFQPIKTGRQQGAKSQAFMSNMKNNIITVTNEPTIDTMGLAESYFTQTQAVNLSDSIKLAVDQYDFTNGSIFYWRYFILVAVPAEGIVLMYNLSTNSWESPQTIPVSRFYIVDGELYGHSYLTSESYQLFTGYADRVYPDFSGFPINAVARFSYQNYGSRTAYKWADSLYVEGYISANTLLDVDLTYELDGCATMKNFQIAGSDRAIVCIPSVQGGIGKASLGKIKLGSDSVDSLTGLPPKFRVKQSLSNTNFFESSLTFRIQGVDQRFELLAFGLNVSEASELTPAITK